MADSPEKKEGLRGKKTLDNGKNEDISGQAASSLKFGRASIEKASSHEKLVARAREELKKDGITSEQREGYGPRSDRLYKNVSPLGYAYVWNAMEYLFGPFESRQVIEESSFSKNLNSGTGGRIKKQRDDAWALYLGLPQKYNTFAISDYKPANSTGNKYYFCLVPKYEDRIFQFAMKNKPAKESGKTTLATHDVQVGVMGNFKISFAQDEKGPYVSYYDVWDLDPNYGGYAKFKAENFAGKPYEIYNRIYYNPETGEKLITSA